MEKYTNTDLNEPTLEERRAHLAKIAKGLADAGFGDEPKSFGDEIAAEAYDQGAPHDATAQLPIRGRDERGVTESPQELPKRC